MAVILLFASGAWSRAEEPLRLDIVRSGTNVILTWTYAAAALETSLSVTGAWSQVIGANGSYTTPATNARSYYRLRVVRWDVRYVAPSYTSLPNGSCGCTSPENPNSRGVGVQAQDDGLGSVLLPTGELTQDAVDLEIPGRGFDWRFQRHYRSGMSYDGPLGHGWEFNYNQRLAVQTNGDVLRMDGLGRADRYVWTGAAWQSPGGFYTRLTHNPDGTYDERDPHGTVYTYLPPDTTNIAKLARIRDRNSNEMDFQYNPSGQLAVVLDTLGRSNTCSYDVNGRLSYVTDFANRSLHFTYDINGNLMNVTSPSVTGTPNGNDFPLGKTTHYTYSSGFADNRLNHNLLTVTAPNELAAGGPPRLIARYDTNSASTNIDRVVSVTLGGTNVTGLSAGGTLSFGYLPLGSAPSNDFSTAVLQTMVTNRNGNASRYRFNSLLGVVEVIHLTRGLRLGEGPGYTTSFAYNRDGEVLARTNAELDSIAYTFDSANTNRLGQGNKLLSRWLPGIRGADQNQIVTSQTYETNYNFVVTITDGRSNTTTYSYDNHGNRTNTIFSIPSVVEDAEYNAFGQVTARVWPDNGSGHRRRDVMSYYASGPQTGYLQSQTEDAGGFNLTTTYIHDSLGNTVQTIDPRGNATLYTYNALNQCVQEASRPLTGGVRNTNLIWYDANGNRVRADLQNRDASGQLQPNTAFTTLMEYDILDKLTRKVREKGAANLANNVLTYGGIPALLRLEFLTIEHRYDANGNLNLTRFGQATSGGDPFNTVQCTFDERDLPFLETRAAFSPLQATTRSDYDGNGNLEFMFLGLESVPRTNIFRHDGFDRLASSVDPMGNTTTNHYDANGNKVSERMDGEFTDVPGSSNNVRLAEALFGFDPMDRLTTRAAQYFDPQTQTNIGSGQAVTLFGYAPISELISITDANTNTTFYTYDRMNRRSVVTDAKSNTVTYLYDTNSNLRQKVELHRSDISGQSDEIFTNQYGHDNLDRLVSVTDNRGDTIQYAHDSLNNVTICTNGRGNRTFTTFDGLNRKIQTVALMTDSGYGTGLVVGGVTNRQTWDDSSHLTSTVDCNGNVTQYFYDSRDHCTNTIRADGTSSGTAFDIHGNPIASIDPNGTTVLSTFDLLDRLTSNHVSQAPGVLGTTFESYNYNGLSQPVWTYNDAGGSIKTFDSLSHCAVETLVFNIAGLVGYYNIPMKYDAMGNQIERGHPSGTLLQSFDSLNRLKVSRFSQGGAGSTNAVYQYRGPTRVARVDYGNGTRMDLAYDSAARIAGIDHSLSGVSFYNRQLAWDPDNNLMWKTDPGGIIEAQEDGWDSLDRLVSVTDFVTGRSAHYNLDLMGNRTNVDNGPGATNYYMNPAIPPGDFQMNRYSIGPSNTARFYDANGNLISANGHTCNYNFRGQLTAVDNGAIKLSYYPDGRQFGKVSYYNTNLIIYAGEDIIQEFDFAAGNSIRYVTANGQVLRVTALNGHDYFSHPDQLANTIAMTDTNGSVVENFSYDEFGTPSHIASISGNPFLHQASRYEPQIGWYLSGANYLDPAAGRFVAGPAMAAFIGDNQYNFPNIPLSVGPSNQWPHTGVEIFALATVQRPPPPPPPPPPTTGPCPHREISYMFFTPWHRTTSATHAVSTLPGHEPRTIAWADVKWQRELMAVWAHCTLQANHLGPHNCIEDGKAEVHTVFNEDSHYGLGQSQGPPQNHWTDESGIPVKP